MTVLIAATYLDNHWHHVAARLSAAGTRLYVDGAQVATNATVTTGANYTAFVRIGWDNMTGWTPVATNPYFTGELDEVAFYTTALAATRITAHWTASRP